MQTLRAQLLLSTLALALAPGAIADAQEEEEEEPAGEEVVDEPTAEEIAARDRARELFTEGVEFVRIRDYESAAGRFESALALHQAASIHHNLAVALAELERPVEAYPHVRAVLDDESAAPAIRSEAEALEARLRGQLAFLRLNVGARDAQLRISLDGVPRAGTDVGHFLPVLPGAHHLLVQRGDETLLDREFQMQPGERSSVELHIREGEVTIAPGSIDFTAAPGSDDGLYIGLGVGIGGGVVVLGVVAVVLALVLTASPEAAIAGNFLPAVVTFP